MVEIVEKEKISVELADKIIDDQLEEGQDEFFLMKQETKTKKSLLRGSVTMDKNALKNKLR